MVKLPELKIGKLIAKVPIIQGGMAIRLSTARLAAAVANEGGIGLIAASGMPFEELRHEIRLARKLTPNGGIVGINVMVAARQFKELVAVAIEEGIDLVVAGAGFSRDMFSWGRKAELPLYRLFLRQNWLKYPKPWVQRRLLWKAPRQAGIWERTDPVGRLYRKYERL